MEKINLNNSGDRPLQVPGFGDVPIEYQLPYENRFAHGFNEWDQAPAVTACELKMVATMNNITDKTNWAIDINNDDMVARWRSEAFDQYWDLGDKAWDWCLTELRDKAVEYQKKDFIRVLDTGSCVCKSDTLITEECHANLQSAINELYKEQRKPSTTPDEQIFNIVDPSIFPLIYGKTRTFRDQGAGELRTLFEFGSEDRTKRAPGHLDVRTESAKIQSKIDDGTASAWNCGQYVLDSSKPGDYHWSTNFQWLPCEVNFKEQLGTSVKITSYINNLHTEYTDIYRGIEKLISAAIEPWNECLIKGKKPHKANQTQRGPVPLRIVTFGVIWKNELPEWALAFNTRRQESIERYMEAKIVLDSFPENVQGKEKERRGKAQRRIWRTPWLEGSILAPEPTDETWRLAREYLESPEPELSAPTVLPEGWEKNVWELICEKTDKHEYWEHPQPGLTFSYDDWKAGRNVDRAIVNMISAASNYREASPLKGPNHERYKVQIQDEFRQQGLQVIVELGGIELTPQSPSFSGSAWQLEGHMNEHIVATAMYTYDVSNVTPCRIGYRQETPLCFSIYRYQSNLGIRCKLDAPNTHHAKSNRSKLAEVDALAQTFGLEWDDLDEDMPGNAAPYQTLGSVEMRQGRLITFPNVIENRLEPFELVDPTQNGHHRYITLYLVDPNYRICSTRNVPPQQHEWWAEAVSPVLMEKGLPRELADKITALCARQISDRKARKVKETKEKEIGWSNMMRRCQMYPYCF